jgi:S-disulfanyl-L-cysteine oxidoreductase SoxD
MFKARSLVVLWLVAAGLLALAQQIHYGIGKPATPEEIRTRGISVTPDGRGLPTGHGTAIQGRSVYVARCAGCHGKRGQGSVVNPALVGGRGTLTTDKPLATVGSYWPYATTLWDYIHRAMPYQNPGSLTSDQVYSVTAYILFMNKIVGEHEELNKETLPKVRMPNRNGFVRDPRPDVK